MDAEDMDMDETDYGFLTPQQRYKRLLADSSFSIQLTSTYTIISSPFIQNFTAAPELVLVVPDSTIFTLLSTVMIIFATGFIVFAAWDYREAAWEKANANKKPLKIKKSSLVETVEDKRKREDEEEEEKKRQDQEFEAKYGNGSAEGSVKPASDKTGSLKGSKYRVSPTEGGSAHDDMDKEIYSQRGPSPLMALRFHSTLWITSGKILMISSTRTIAQLKILQRHLPRSLRRAIGLVCASSSLEHSWIYLCSLQEGQRQARYEVRYQQCNSSLSCSLPQS